MNFWSLLTAILSFLKFIWSSHQLKWGLRWAQLMGMDRLDLMIGKFSVGDKGMTHFRFDTCGWRRVGSLVGDKLLVWYWIEGSFNCVLEAEIKTLETDLKAWNKEALVNVHNKNLIVLDLIGFWDSKAREGFSQMKEGQEGGSEWFLIIGSFGGDF